MNADHEPIREVALPAASLRLLRRSLREEAGPLGATHALHAAGYGVGEPLFRLLQDELGEGFAGMEEQTFWSALARLLAERGWGNLTHRKVHPGVGLLTSSDWAEADPEAGETQPSCPFATGLLAGLLGKAADGPVAVLEVACRSRGDEACSFAFGSEAAIHDLYGFLLDDLTFEEALASL